MGNDTGKAPPAQSRARETNRLSAMSVKRKTKPGRHPDGAGLYLQISKTGAKSWVLRYQLGGKERMLGLGPLRVIALKQARERAQAARLLLVDKKDPVETRRNERVQARLEAAQRKTFKEVAEAYLRIHESTWKSAVHRQQWRQSLEQYVYPVIGNKAVAAVDKDDLLAVLEPIWSSKQVTAQRLRGRIEKILDAAKVQDLRVGENPARWRGHLDKLLQKPGKAKRHHPAMAFEEVPDFVAELQTQGGVAARALEFAILTAARASEVCEALWSEFDLAKREWVIPGERIKSGREHKVPLSARAVEILEALPREAGNPHVFLGGRHGKPLHRQALLLLLKGMRPALTVHGFRSSFSDWANEKTNFSSHAIELALAHQVGAETERAYRRGDMLDKRRALMDAWASYCAGEAAGTVVTGPWGKVGSDAG